MVGFHLSVSTVMFAFMQWKAQSSPQQKHCFVQPLINFHTLHIWEYQQKSAPPYSIHQSSMIKKQCTCGTKCNLEMIWTSLTSSAVQQLQVDSLGSSSNFWLGDALNGHRKNTCFVLAQLCWSDLSMLLSTGQIWVCCLPLVWSGYASLAL